MRSPTKEELTDLIFSYTLYRDIAQSSLDNNNGFAFRDHHIYIIESSNKKIELLQCDILHVLQGEPSWIENGLDEIEQCAMSWKTCEDAIKLEVILSWLDLSKKHKLWPTAWNLLSQIKKT